MSNGVCNSAIRTIRALYSSGRCSRVPNVALPDLKLNNLRQTMSDFATRREIMVDTQIRPADVTKFPVLEAMLKIPREHFVPRDKREVAYIGENVPFDDGRVVIDPRTLAKFLDFLDVGQNELVLDIGSGLGYSSAILSCLAEVVVALEDDCARIAEIEETVQEMGLDNICVQKGILHEGAPQHGPYDVIIIQGAVENIPLAILSQLKNDGRIAALFMEGRLGEARIGYKFDGQINWRFAFNAGAPVLKGFHKVSNFVL